MFRSWTRRERAERHADGSAVDGDPCDPAYCGVLRQRLALSVFIRIQHAPGRDGPLARLCQLLPPTVEVITDSDEPPPNPWRGYKKCLSDLPAKGHVCVLQDDALPCKNFAAALELIADANPDVPVVLFCGGLPRRTAQRINQALLKGDTRYVDLAPHDFLPVVAMLWPVEIAERFMQWATENPNRLPGGRTARSDDAVGGRWIRFARQRIRVTAPSLVEHDDVFPSTISTLAAAGKNRARVAAQWIGEKDPLELDWS